MDAPIWKTLQQRHLRCTEQDRPYRRFLPPNRHTGNAQATTPWLLPGRRQYPYAAHDARAAGGGPHPDQAPLGLPAAAVPVFEDTLTHGARQAAAARHNTGLIARGTASSAVMKPAAKNAMWAQDALEPLGSSGIFWDHGDLSGQ